MGNLIKETFNKEENISKEDIEKYIITPSLKESAIYEYKSTDKIKKDKKGRLTDEKGQEINKEGILIQPLVAFLNKFTPEGGLLILGICDEDGIPRRIAAGNKELITREQLRGWIYENISSFPSIRDFPELDVKKVEINGESIFLIEIHPKDTNTVYFSKLTNIAYRRKGDTSIPLSLPEAFEMIKNKIIAKIFVRPTTKIREEEDIADSKWVRHAIKFSYINVGNKPGEWVRSILGFEIIKGELKDIIITPLNGWTFGGSLNNCFSVFQTDSYLKDVIYPKEILRYTIGELGIRFLKNNILKMCVDTFEYEGFSQQIFFISSEGIKEVERNFKSYIAM